MKLPSGERRTMLACSVVFCGLLAGLCWWLLKQDPSGPTWAFCGMMAFAGLIFLMLPFQACGEEERLARDLGLELFGVFWDSPKLRGSYKGFPVLVRKRWTGPRAELLCWTTVELALPGPSPLRLRAGRDAAEKLKGEEGLVRLDIPDEQAEAYGQPAPAALEFLRGIRGSARLDRVGAELASLSISGDRLEAEFVSRLPWETEPLAGMLNACVRMAGALAPPADS